jgi:uracil-DNA glycosylase family 4
MPPEQQLRAYVDYLRDMGIYDLYRRNDPQVLLPEGLREKLLAATQPMSAAKAAALVPRVAATVPPVALPVARKATPTAVVVANEPPPSALYTSMPKPPHFDTLAVLPTQPIAAADRAAALDAVRAEIGDCTRCPLAYAGRHTIVFADGDPNARLMFVGEGPGADEDTSGVPFVGKAGQLLNNMIAAMGLKREEVYIANIVKCRPPANRQPEFVEATTCSQFLVKQIDIVRPQVIVALGATAATYLLGVKQSLASLRGEWHSVRGAKVAVTYHPAFLLRDPRQKGEAWKDLQRVMAELGLKPPAKAT